MTASRPRPRRLPSRFWLLALVTLSSVLVLSRSASAEKILMKGDGWQVYSDGRVAGFLSYVHGDGPPIPTVVTNPDGTTTVTVNTDGGGWSGQTLDKTATNQGTIDMWRLRSGFLGNQLGLGFRSQVTPWTTATAYIQVWAYIESDARTKGFPNPADIRQGYGKLEGPWGSFLAGRTRTLFSRGATDINVLYAHKWGVGFPSAIDAKGPTQGMVGFGVLGSGFAAAMIYGTPVLGGFQLNVGAFDPTQLSGAGWFRTRGPRAEAELTFERTFGATGKIVLFANGAYQKVYKADYCAVTATSPGPCEATADGVGYGGRFELGFFHLGVAGHYGKGLGLNYALENSYAALDQLGNLRAFDGYYVQSQFVIRSFDLFAGWGITRVFLTDFDKAPVPAGMPPVSVIKYQMGANAGVVYNYRPNIHFDLEYFRAQAAWWLGEKQILNTGAFGMTINW